MSKEQGDAFSKKCYIENVCKNCGGCDSRFPVHKSFQCPHQCRWAPAWPDEHVPVKMTGAPEEKVMNPVLPASEEPKPDFETKDTNYFPTYDESEMFSTIFDSTMHPISSIQDSPNFTREEKQAYQEMLGSDDDEPSSAPIPDPENLQRWEAEERTKQEIIEDIVNATVFVDQRMQIVQPTAALRISAAITDYIIDPVTYMVMMISMLACGIHAGASHLWRKIPLSIRTWTKWIIVSIVIAMILAALVIHAWDKPDHDTDITSTPDIEWYSRDDDFINRRVQENRTDIVSCISNTTKRPRVHDFTAFDAAGKMYRVWVDSFAEISLISPAKIQGSWEVTGQSSCSTSAHGGHWWKEGC